MNQREVFALERETSPEKMQVLLSQLKAVKKIVALFCSQDIRYYNKTRFGKILSTREKFLLWKENHLQKKCKSCKQQLREKNAFAQKINLFL